MVQAEDLIDNIKTINEFAQGEYITRQYIHSIYGLIEVTVLNDDVDPNEMIFIDKLNEIIEERKSFIEKMESINYGGD